MISPTEMLTQSRKYCCARLKCRGKVTDLETHQQSIYIYEHRFCEVFLFAFSIRGKSELLDKNSWESLRGGHKKADRKTMSLADEAERGWICSRDEWECVTVRGQLTSVTAVGKGVRDCICLWVCMCVLRRSPWGEEDQREME